MGTTECYCAGYAARPQNVCQTHLPLQTHRPRAAWQRISTVPHGATQARYNESAPTRTKRCVERTQMPRTGSRLRWGRCTLPSSHSVFIVCPQKRPSQVRTVNAYALTSRPTVEVSSTPDQGPTCLAGSGKVAVHRVLGRIAESQGGNGSTAHDPKAKTGCHRSCKARRSANLQDELVSWQRDVTDGQI